ncbi:MAG: peptidylprolyl isomerase [Oscillospiraceae bacterium]|nr:peptidylprolyl isomerase [Oscillospiraceae bacterium]
MQCEFCNAEIGEARRFCPECGKSLEVETEELELTPEVPAEPAEMQETPIVPEEQEKPEKKKSNGNAIKLALLIAGMVAVIAILALVLLKSFGVSLFPQNDVTPEDISQKLVYTVDAEDAAPEADTIVATLGKHKMNNALLQVFFTDEFLAFITDYYSYISYIGLDLNKSLHEQTCYFDETLNWEQFMLRAGLETWQSYVMMCELAERYNYDAEADWQVYAEEMETSLAESAAENEYASVDEMIKARYGENCTKEIYMEYAKLQYVANAFYSSQFAFTEEQIAEAFTANETALAEDGITKTSGFKSSVRHLLVMPEGGTTDETSGTKTYSDEEWAACLDAAEKLLQQWKDGEATEDSFADLVGEHTDDTASASVGGLYEDIVDDGTYMQEFQDWAVDPARQVGETGIVRTSAGYHIMYFVEGEPEWIYFTELLLQDAKVAEMQEKMEAIMSENELKVQYSKIFLEKIY